MTGFKNIPGSCRISESTVVAIGVPMVPLGIQPFRRAKASLCPNLGGKLKLFGIPPKILPSGKVTYSNEHPPFSNHTSKDGGFSVAILVYQRGT